MSDPLPHPFQLHDCRAPVWLLAHQIDAPPRIDFCAWSHPVLAIPCPACGSASGSPCVRPSGHQATDRHALRRTAADQAFIEQHGPDARLAVADGRWLLDRQGRTERDHD